MSQLKKNVLYSLTLTFSRFFFPIITYPYISRVLGPDKIGVLNFSENYSNYFVVLAALGIPLYGVREIAKIKHKPHLLNKTFTEISIIHVISSLLCLAFYTISIFTIPSLHDQLGINILFGANILINLVSFEWFLIGIEKFKLIALRSMVTKLIPIVLMFVLVKDEGDYIIYQSLNTLAFLLNAVINIANISRITTISFKEVNIKRHLPPLFTVFFSGAFIHFYSMVDSLVLGFVSNYKAVGFYATAIKLNKMICLVIASVGNVLVPRISNLIALNDTDQIESVLRKSLLFTIFLTVPLAAGLYLLSPELIFILAGSDFEQSIKASQILSPIIILMGLSNVFGIQLLLPYAKEKELLKIFLTGTALSLFLNLILAKSYGYLGSSTATLLTELILTVITFYFAKNIIKLSLPWKYFFGCILFSLLFFPLIHFIREITEDHISILLYSLISCSAVYVGLQVLFFRHYFVDELLTFLRTMLLKKNQ